MASRSATVLVIFIVAVLAFCLASVFASMTGQISIVPNETESNGGILDNLSAITDDNTNDANSYNYQDYSSDSSDDSSNDDDSYVETTKDTSDDDSSSSRSSHYSSKSSSDVETTTDDSSSSKESDDSDVETTTG